MTTDLDPFTSAAQWARRLAAGEVTAPDVVDLYLDRIARIDPTLNAYRIVRGDAARAEAAEAQRRLDAGERASLLGVPIAVKDDTDVAGETTAWGTAAHGPPKASDAEVVGRLRAAGAVVLGKTNVPELTIWPFTESSTFGATRNPWRLDRSPGGSSGGSAAAVAAGLAPLALGTDGGGSIRTPAAWCGLVGLKPQRDRVPMHPHDDGWYGLIVTGPIARTVEDLALFLDATTDGGFVASASRPPGRRTIVTAAASPLGPLVRAGRPQRSALIDAAELLRSLGHDVVDRRPRYPAIRAGLHATVRYLRGVHDDAATLPRPERLDPRTRRLVRAGGLIPRSAVERLRRTESGVIATVDRLLGGADVLLLPATATGPPPVGGYADHGVLRSLPSLFRASPFQSTFNVTGHPALVVPWGLDDDGVPTAIQLVGRTGGEATLLAVAAQIESARPWADRRPPIAC